MATLGIGLSKVFILDKYFNELSKYWETEIKLQGTYNWNRINSFFFCIVIVCSRDHEDQRGFNFGETKDVWQVTEIVRIDDGTCMWSDNRIKYDGAIGLWWFFKNSISRRCLPFFVRSKRGKILYCFFSLSIKWRICFFSFLIKWFLFCFKHPFRFELLWLSKSRSKKQLNNDGEWHRIEDKRTNGKTKKNRLCTFGGKTDWQLDTAFVLLNTNTHTQCCSHLISVQK